jgi:hypothetical protein
MRACIEGRAPLDAKHRRERDTLKPAQVAFRGRYADNLLRAIDWAMEMDPTQRPQSIAAFRAALTADTRPEPARSAIGRLANVLLGRSSS